MEQLFYKQLALGLSIVFVLIAPSNYVVLKKSRARKISRSSMTVLSLIYLLLFAYSVISQSCTTYLEITFRVSVVEVYFLF